MRRASFVMLFAAALACEPDTQAMPVMVQWMDWPADVAAGTPFRTRLVVFGVCALRPAFRPGGTADVSAVTFAPYFLGEQGDIVCAYQRTTELLILTAIDTAGMAPGLSAEFPRTYEMRATTSVYARSLDAADAPARTFGDVTVRPLSPVLDPYPSTRRNAAGYAYLVTDSLGCARIRPVGLYGAGAAIVLENPVDTAALYGSFVRGYIHVVDPQVCGESTVFHLVSRN
jgi:hypothetical protein